MNTFLELVQALRQEAGIGGTGPTSVVGASGEYKRLVDWVAQAWVDIQELHREWSFRWGRFTLTTDPEQTVPSEYGVCDSGIESVYPKSLSWYSVANGSSYRTPLAYLDYEDYVERYGRAPNTPGAPRFATVLPNTALKLHPDPDAAYVIGGDYCRSIQVLTLDADEPLLPENHRNAILLRALLLYAEHEEAQGVIATASAEYNQRLNRLRRMYLPQLKFVSEAIA